MPLVNQIITSLIHQNVVGTGESGVVAQTRRRVETKQAVTRHSSSCAKKFKQGKCKKYALWQ